MCPAQVAEERVDVFAAGRRLLLEALQRAEWTRKPHLIERMLYSPEPPEHVGDTPLIRSAARNMTADRTAVSAEHLGDFGWNPRVNCVRSPEISALSLSE